MGTSMWKGLMVGASGILLLMTGAAGYGVLTWRASLPVLDGAADMPALTAPVTIESDRYGVPVITARSRPDAMRALGYVTARDRLFQMDLLRRRSAGTLAEVLGQGGLESDRSQRWIGLQRAAQEIVSSLPVDQRELLQAYAEGVNASVERMGTLPVEFLLLGYRPAPWLMEDSLLVVLGMFQTLTWSEEDERMRSTMIDTLPADVVAFLVPEVDRFTRAIRGEPAGGEMPPIPAEALARLRQAAGAGPDRWAAAIRFTDAAIGSNAWAVGGAKTADGRAILANDMHLNLSVPNVWYRVELRYDDVHVSGLIMPGVPAIIVGSNGHVAWGLTNLGADVLDLVRVDRRAGASDEYRIKDGWARMEQGDETIKVKGGANVNLRVMRTVWGPVAPQLLAGQAVAIHWTALDPAAVDLGLLGMDRARTLEEAIGVVNRAGGPTSNVILADANGRIAWTCMGRIPLRAGHDGSSSVSWADGTNRWVRYLAPDELPRLVNPPSGFLVSANHRATGKDYPYLIGHVFANGYRAYRIGERLQNMNRITEPDLFRLQLDTTTQFYEVYQRIALEVLTEAAIGQRPLLADIRAAIDGWNGQADADSVGLGLLVRFRRSLAQTMFAPFLRPCRDQDAGFRYGGDIDTPLERLLIERDARLLPEPEIHEHWEAFLIATLEESAGQLQKEYGRTAVRHLTWGRMNRARITHPLGLALPAMGWIANMPEDELPGCGFCVRLAAGTVSASERLVISPGRPQDGILHMPGGQSGHALSPHYRDQHGSWVTGAPLPFSSGRALHTLHLRSAARSLSTGHDRKPEAT